jgi:hypothetical protein
MMMGAHNSHQSSRMTIRACDRIKFRKFCRWGNELMKVRPGLDLVYRSPEKLPNFMTETSPSLFRRQSV